MHREVLKPKKCLHGDTFLLIAYSLTKTNHLQIPILDIKKAGDYSPAFLFAIKCFVT